MTKNIDFKELGVLKLAMGEVYVVSVWLKNGMMETVMDGNLAAFTTKQAAVSYVDEEVSLMRQEMDPWGECEYEVAKDPPKIYTPDNVVYEKYIGYRGEDDSYFMTVQKLALSE